MAPSIDWQKIREAFERCLELSTIERDSFLKTTFNGDHRSHHEVLQLLAGDQQAVSSNFLDWNAAEPFDRENTLQPGDTMGDYQVVERVGTGGSGVVYKVISRDDRTKTLAMKVLHSWRHDEEGIRRFRREVDVLRQLDHPGIAQCLEYGETDKTLYLVMPFVDGQDLGQYLQRNKTPIRQKIEMFLAICESVAHAHEHLILHRDLKPANIMVDSAGKPIVTDFGLAKLVDDSAESLDLTTTGHILGTPAFMAPEQTGGSSAPSMTTDVYGLGAVLYFLLTDRPPFSGDNLFDVGHAIRTTRPQGPRSINESVDKRLGAICLKCMEKAQKDRYPTVSALADDVDRYLKGLSVSAKPKSAGQQLLDLAKKHRWVTMLTLTLLISLLAGLILTAYFWQHSTAQANLLLQLIEKQVEEINSTIEEPDSLKSRTNELRFLTNTFTEFEQLAALDEKTQDRAAVSWFLLGRAENYLGNRQPAEVAYGNALLRFRLLAKDHPDNLGYQFDIFHCLNSLQLHDEALAQAQLVVALDGEKNPDYLAALGAAMFARASEDCESGKFGRALETAKNGLEFANKHFGPRDGGLAERRRIASFEWLLARLKLVEGDLAAAIEFSKSSAGLQHALSKQFPANVGLHRELCQNLGLLFQIQFQLDDRAQAEQTLKILESKSSRFSDRFGDYYQSWQALDEAYRLRWFYEREYGTPESVRVAAEELDKFLVDWDSRFPSRVQVLVRRIWLLAHPANERRNLAEAKHLLEVVNAINSISGQSILTTLTIPRLDPEVSEERMLETLPAVNKQLFEVIPRFWEKF